MNFLIILAVVLMVHQGEWMHYFQRDEWFVPWLLRVSEAVRYQAWIPFLLIAAVPALIVGLVLVLASAYWWLVFVINSSVLLYAIGRGSWRDECSSWVQFFAERDPVILKQKLAERGKEASEISDTDIENIWLKAREDVLYHQLDGFYTTVFWFFFACAPLALFYRLVHLYQSHEKTLKGELPSMEFVLVTMEWLPVRMLALFFCLVGNFSTGFWVLKQIVLDATLTSSKALARCADAALFLDGSVDDDSIDNSVDEVSKSRTVKLIERMEARALEQKTLAVMRRNSVELEALMQRSEWAFLVLVAIIALA